MSNENQNQKEEERGVANEDNTLPSPEHDTNSPPTPSNYRPSAQELAAAKEHLARKRAQIAPRVKVIKTDKAFTTKFDKRRKHGYERATRPLLDKEVISATLSPILDPADVPACAHQGDRFCLALRFDRDLSHQSLSRHVCRIGREKILDKLKRVNRARHPRTGTLLFS